MAETWPGGLQDKLNESGFSHSLGGTAFRSEMEVGPAKVRRRFTRPIDRFNCSINLTTAEYSTFYYFFNTTLNGGANTFDFIHPITGDSKEFRFTGAPDVRSIGGGNFQVSMSWEQMPE